MTENNWEKIVYKENDENINVIQGRVTDEGDFLKVEGTYKQVLLNKNHIISRTTKTEECERGKQDEQKNIY